MKANYQCTECKKNSELEFVYSSPPATARCLHCPNGVAEKVAAVSVVYNEYANAKPYTIGY
jgi:hypothetical protein